MSIEKITSSKPFQLLLTLVFSVALFAYVTGSFSSGASKNDNHSTSTQTTKINVPVNIHYDSNKYYVNGAPKTISVTITGPSGLILTATRSRALSANVNLDNPKLGVRNAKIELSGFAASIDAKPSKTKIPLTIIKKITKKLDIRVSYNQDSINKDFMVQSFKLSKERALITGPKNLVDIVDHVIGSVELPNKLDQSITRQVDLKAVDKNGNDVKTDINPEQIDVTLILQAKTANNDNGNISKDVPINVVYSGKKDPDNYDIQLNTTKIQLKGPKSTLDTINFAILNVDLDSFANKGGSQILSIEPIDGVPVASPDKVEVTIKLKNNKETKNNGN
ncbi:MAG: hypothetical protein LBC17_01285 [Lactobacillaceae bacterium]|jgi:YbbR domain-containing protein|nr:hypothetical protein [Lactobacillaceae bacterium]